MFEGIGVSEINTTKEVGPYNLTVPIRLIYINKLLT